MGLHKSALSLHKGAVAELSLQKLGNCRLVVPLKSAYFIPNRHQAGLALLSGGSMRRSLSLVGRLVMAVAVLTASAARAEAITLREIVELTKAGLSEEVLLALIEVDQRVFSIDSETLKSLQDAGVSPRVIVAIVKSGRMPAAEPVVPERIVTERIIEVERADPPAPQIVVIDRPVVHVMHDVPVAVPVYVAVGGHPTARQRNQPYVVAPSPFIPFGSVTAPRVEPDPPKRAEPVYWGFGGKRRPDTWQDK
jgi:hypothetical protein